jgi:hypothetical protein
MRSLFAGACGNVSAAEDLVGLWAADGDVARIAVRLKAAGADEVVTTLHGAVQRVREHAPLCMAEPSRARRDSMIAAA